MAFIVPNAGDTTSGNRYEALDQAEPDSIDFEVLSLSGSGVVSGCAVTTNNSATTVAVEAGITLLKGVPYVVAANSALVLPTAPADNRFDLIVARVTSGTAAATVLQGENSSTNPQFTKSLSVKVGGPTSADFNPDTDVLLAAVYRSGASTVTSSRIVDKRIQRYSSIVRQGSVTPSTSVGSGSLYMKTGAPNGTASGVYVETSTGDWIELARNVGAHFPIGGAFLWPTTAPVPVGCSEANGQSLATASYPACFEVYGYLHGGSGGSFNLPDYNNKYIRGTTNTALLTTTVGADSTTLTTAQLPSHAHGLNSHTHTLSHTHGINHTHSSASTSTAGAHSHDVSDSILASLFSSPPGMEVLTNTAYSGSTWVTYSASNPISSTRAFTPVSSIYVSVPPHQTDATSAHQHTLTVPSYTGSTTSQSTSTTTAASGNTTNTGSGASIENRPASAHARWLIRTSLGDDPSFTGGTPAFTAAYQETFVVELFAEGEAVSADISLGTSFRMPWAGEITDVRASVGVASTTGPIVIDVNEGGTVAAPGASVLGTKLSIDEGELTSTTATTPHTITDNHFADDALVTFDVDSPGAGAEGPLTVTLYITRDA